MLDDDDFTPDSEDLFGLIEYELHEPCILAGPRSQNHGATRRFDGRQIHRTPLGLRDDLLCDDDDVSDDDRDRGQDGEEVMIHGEAHTYRYGYGWCVDYPGCPVQSVALDGDDHLDIARTHGPGRHPLHDEWEHETSRHPTPEANHSDKAERVTATSTNR